MRNTNKKGFTIVELVIVVAVIAILAAVLIPTFSSIIRKANESKDNQLIKHLNTALAADLDGDKTMSAAVAAAAEFGFELDKIDAKVEGNEILWDSVANVFCYLNGNKIEYLSDVAKKGTDAELWIIDTDGDDKTHETYSSYVANVEAGKTVVANNSIDVTGCDGVNVEYSKAGSVAIYTNGGKLTVSNESAEVAHYGEADEVIIGAVANASYHEFGKAGFTQVNKGHYVMEKGGSTNALVIATGVTVDNKGGNVVAQYDAADVNIEGVKFGATSFAGGLGTKEEPYLIKTAEHIQNIGANYANHAYYKVADGVENIDCSNWTRVNLNGSFNGNGVILSNVDSVLFNNVGNGADSQAIVIENFTVKFAGGAGIARNCATPNLTFKNINATGYLIEDWNGAIFLRYGSNNFVSGGFSYAVNFENCGSTAEIYSTANAWSSILVGHTYKGNDANTVTINVDAATDSAIDATTLYYSGAEKDKQGYKYYGIGPASVNVDGVATTENKLTGDNVVVIPVNKNPVKTDAAWTLNTEANTTKVVFRLNFQYSLWTENYGERIKDQSGVGGVIGEDIVIEVANGDTINALPQFNSIEIKTGADKWDYEISNGKLIIYMTTDNQYVDGTITLYAEQFVGGSAIPEYKGSVVIVSRDLVNKPGSDWIIK